MMHPRVLFITLLLAGSGVMTALGKVEPSDDAPQTSLGIGGPAASGRPQPGRRFVVGFDPAATGSERAVTRANIRSIIAQQGGQVALESLDDENPFVVFEGISKEHAAGIAREAGRAQGVSYVEEDAVRYPMVRRRQAVDLLASTNPSLQQSPMQPYGLANVQATNFTSTQRSTTSSVDPTKRFPICIIDSGFDATHPALQGVQLLNGDPAGYNTDTCGHGTHVAGTISARNTIDGVLNGAVQLYIIKVFDTSSCGWVYSSSLAVAMQKCQAWGAKIVSMSLGGPDQATAENNQINSMYSGGMLIFAAAGNGGNSAISYPAGYTNAISIAAVDVNNNRAGFSQYNADVELAAPGVSVLSTYPVSLGSPTFVVAVAGGITLNTVDAQLRQMSGSALKAFSGAVASCSATSCPPTAAGKVCLIPRGSISFCDKATACATAGGVAAIIYNNAPGPFSGTLGTSCPTGATIPTFSLPQELAPQFPAGAAVTGTVGPPYAYAYLDGTSMATPHASAVAALVWGQRPSCTNANIRCALQRSALDITTAPAAPGRDPYYGFGVIRAKAAVDRLAGGCACV